MDLRQLETFVHVVKCKSFSKAAEKLFITQPTVTNHIQNLEQELDTMLISRLGRRIKLTDEGTVLYNYALDILNLLDNAKYDLQSIQNDIKGHLTISASSVPRKKILPEIIVKFSNEYPNVTYSIGEKDSNMVVQAILEGETDFGIIGAKFSEQNLDYIEILSDELVLATANTNKFPNENGAVLDKEILLTNKWINREPGSGTRIEIENHLKEANIDIMSIKNRAVIEDTELMISLIEKDFGIGFLSLKSIEDEVKNGKLKYFRVKGLNIQRNFYLVYHQYRKLSPISNLFKNFILEQFKH